MGDKVSTVEEARVILKLSNVNTVYRMIRKGKLPARKLGRSWRISAERLDEFILNLDKDANDD